MLPDFQRDYLVRLPLPLAQLYSRAYNAKDARSRHDNTFYLCEALVKLAAAPAIAGYLGEVEHGAPRVAALDQLLAQLVLPSLGQWLAMLRELARHFGQRPDAASHPLGHLWPQLTTPRRDRPGLLALFQRIKNGPDGQPAANQSCTLLELFDALVQYRNGVFGHGGPRFESFYEKEMGPLLFPAVNEILAEGTLDFLGPRGSRLVYLTELRTVGEDRLEVGLRELVGMQGERMAPLELSAVQAAGLLPNRVALLWPGRAVPLRLDPLLQYRESDTADEVLFLNRDRHGKQVEYLSYTTGRTERDQATAPALAALLSRVVHRSVSEADLQRFAEQSLAETPSVEAILGPAPAAGRVLGDYEVLAELGRGGMGVVYLARQVSLGRLVALKMLPADLAGDEVALARFRREIRHLARCDHPHIVKVLASGAMPDGQLYYTMEYVPGCDLEQVWRELAGPDAARAATSTLGQTTWAKAVLTASRRKREETEKIKAPGETAAPTNTLPLPPLPELPSAADDPGGYVRRVVLLIRDAARAVQSVHEQNVIHRDIKPANLMLTPDGSRVVLMDFGLAKGQSLALTSSKAGGLLGTLRYAAPEQLAAASLKVGPAADVRALGGVLWEMLTRRRLFADAADEAQLAAKVHDEDVPRLRTIDASLDRDLEAIVARATEIRVADRIQTAGQLAEYLQLYLDGKPLPIRPPGTGELLKRWSKKHRTALTAAAAVLLAGVVGVVLAFVRISAERDRAEDLAIREGQARRDAEDAKKIALDLASKEANARQNAEAEKRRAEKQLLRSEWLLYASQIASAQREWEVDNVALAWHYLDATRWDFRDWEHRYLYTLFSGSKQTLRGHTDTVTSVAFSPDGKQLVSGSLDDTVKVWDAVSGQETLTLKGHTDFVTSVAFSPDGKRLVSGSKDQTVKVWDAVSGQETLTLKGHTSGVTSVAFSPDGKRLVSGSNDKTVKVWDAVSGQETLTLKGHTGSVWSVAFSPDGRRLVSGSVDKTVKVWDAVSGQETLTLKGHTDNVTSVAFSPDGKRLVSGSVDETVKVWDAVSGQETLTLKGHTHTVTSVAFSPDGKRLVSGSRDPTVKVWDAVSGQETLTLKGHSGSVYSVAFSPDGKRLVSGSEDETVKVWDAVSGQETLTLKGHTNRVTSVAFGPDGKRLVSGSHDETVKVWDAVSGQETLTLKRHSGSVYSVAFSPDGKRLVSGSRDPTVKVWDAVSDQETLTLKGHTHTVTSVAFSPDGKRLVSGSWDDTVKVWDAASGQETLTLKGHTGSVRSVAFSPDGKRLVSGSDDKTVKVWDAVSGQETLTLKGHTDFVTSVAFSPDGKRLVSGSDDKTVKVWDAVSGQETLTLKGHAGSVESVAFSPDGKRLVSGSYDQTVKVWDAVSGQETLTLKGHTDGVTSVAFSPDGKRLVSGSYDQTVKVWDATSGQETPIRKGQAGQFAEAVTELYGPSVCERREAPVWPAPLVLLRAEAEKLIESK